MPRPLSYDFKFALNPREASVCCRKIVLEMKSIRFEIGIMIASGQWSGWRNVTHALVIDLREVVKLKLLSIGVQVDEIDCGDSCPEGQPCVVVARVMAGDRD